MGSGSGRFGREGGRLDWGCRRLRGRGRRWGYRRDCGFGCLGGCRGVAGGGVAVVGGMVVVVVAGGGRFGVVVAAGMVEFGSFV